MNFSPLTIDHLDPWAELLAIAFERSPRQMRQLLLFLQPETRLLAWGAWDGNQLTAQYSCLRRELFLPTLGHCVPVGLSINMAVHPDYRGRGLVKQVAEPVYAALAAQGGVAGVGFSNAAGVEVDRHSSGYGYRVIGKLRSSLFWLRPSYLYSDFELTSEWPMLPLEPVVGGTAVQFAWTPTTLHHRFACHPFRQYQFGVWQAKGCVAGVVVYRPIRLGGQIPAVALLAAYGRDLDGLLARWLGAVRHLGYRLVQLVSTPGSAILDILEETAVPLPQPISRTKYYLTVKPLSDDLPTSISALESWSCLGGDVL